MDCFEHPIFALALLALISLQLGYGLSFLSHLNVARWLAWGFLALVIVSTELLTSEQTPLFRMGALISLVLLAMKNPVLVETYQGKGKLRYFQWLAFALGWFGMRPPLFEALPSPSLDQVSSFLKKGISRFLLGLACLFVSGYLLIHSPDQYVLTVATSLVGLSLFLHFGLLNLSAALWRASGVACSELFRSPMQSNSLKEFWGKRWNLAFSEMTALVVYRPLLNKTGTASATFIAFLFSGLLHELAISMPVHAGYGGPMLYFVIHGTLMQWEARSSRLQKLLQNPVRAKVWLLSGLLLPLPLLFHEAFMRQVAFPFVRMVTAPFFAL